MLWIDLDRRRSSSLTQQLYDQLIARILAGELPAGERLPSSRRLADDLRIARNVVVGVFEQLQAEGYLEPRPGSGTFVAQLDLPRLPGEFARAGPVAPQRLVPEARSNGVIAFRCGIPDLAAFPRARWMQAVRAVGFHASDETWSYDEAGGLLALREAIATRLSRLKGIRCKANQIVLTGGSAHAMGLLGLFFANRVRTSGALVENPVISFVPEMLRLCGHAITPVPADADGLVIDALPARPRAAFIFVSPAHQFPLGGTLPVARRLALLEYARGHDLFVVEDDYDAEFRYSGVPVSSLFRLDPNRVIHLGTFSKSLAPSLRLGYLVLPPALATDMLGMLKPLYIAGSRFTHAVMARFLSAGHLDRHVERMRRAYARKMHALCAALNEAFGARVAISGHTTGLHLVARFPGRKMTEDLREACVRGGVRFETVADYTLDQAESDAILLGFGNLSVDEIREGVRRLKVVMRRPR